METLLTRPPHSPHRPWRAAVAATVGVVAAVLLFLAVEGLIRPPEQVPRVEIRNAAPIEVEVLVRGDGDRDLLSIATVDAGRRAVADDVTDQGERWTFVVRSAGSTLETFTLTRDELVDAGWRVTVGEAPAGAADAPSTGGG